ncbi:MAG: 2Fe-2S iron-sulfur cluster binding domain-containing protein, partial [Sphingobacteriales bacterium]
YMTQSYIRKAYRGNHLSRILYDARLEWAKEQGISQEKIHFELFSVPVTATAASIAINAAITPTGSTPTTDLTTADSSGMTESPIAADPFGMDESPIAADSPGMKESPIAADSSETTDISETTDSSANTDSSTEKSPVSHITIKQDGLSLDFNLPFDSESILEAGLDHGADLPFSCKGGVCSTCRARLIEGEVEMEVNYALEPEEVAAGYILVCQSRPISNRVIIDFDIR